MKLVDCCVATAPSVALFLLLLCCCYCCCLIGAKATSARCLHTTRATCRQREVPQPLGHSPGDLYLPQFFQAGAVSTRLAGPQLVAKDLVMLRYTDISWSP